MLTITKGKDKIVLHMYPVQYHHESQILGVEATSNDEGQSNAKYDEVTNAM